MYQEKNYENLLGTQGFSDKLLTTHFSLYSGYVANTNALIKKLREVQSGTPEHAEMQRRLGWEWNGMRLHELYFENMSKDNESLDDESRIAQKIRNNCGSFDKWKEDFIAVAKMRGIGWTIFYEDLRDGELFNAWVSEHDMGHLAGCKPLLVLDVFEHAYVFDYGMKKPEYIEAFFNALNWKEIDKRFVK